MINQIFLIRFFVFFIAAGCMANAESPASDNEITSYNGQTSGKGVVVAPSSLQELQAVIRQASSDGKKVRVAGADHSTSSLILSDDAYYIKTTNLNAIGADIESENGENLISVEAGVKLGVLSDSLHSRGYSLGFAFPAFRGLTVAGLIATGSHGSSRRYTAISSQTVREIQLVTANGDLEIIHPEDQDSFKAATVNLGLLGVVYKLKIKVVPEFNLKVTTRLMDLKQESLSNFIKGPAVEDYLFVLWFPNQEKAIIESGEMTSQNPDPGAENVNLGLHLPLTSEDYLTKGALALGRTDPTGMADAFVEKKRVEGLISKPRFLLQKDGQDVQSLLVTGSSNKMTLARGDSLNWPYTLTDNSFSFPVEKTDEVMETIAKFAKDKNYSFPVAGISLRFGSSDGARSSFLSDVEDGSSEKKLFVLAEFLEYKPLGTAPIGHTGRDALRDQLMETLITQNHVKLHWGKNNDLSMHQLALQPRTEDYQEALDKFEQKRNEFDPNGVFSSKFTLDLLAGKSAESLLSERLIKFLFRNW